MDTLFLNILVFKTAIKMLILAKSNFLNKNKYRANKAYVSTMEMPDLV